MVEAIEPAEIDPTEIQRQASPAGSAWFHAFALALIVDVAAFGFLGRPTEMGVGGGLLILGLVFSRLELFKSVKGFGLEAELLEKKLERAEKVTSEAFATAAQVRELAKALAANAFALTSQIGLWSTMALTERLRVADEIRGALGSMGLSGDEVATLSEPIRHVARHQMARRIQEVGTLGGMGENVNAEFEVLANWEKRFVAPASEFRAIATKHALTGDVLEVIADLEFFDRENKLRRPEMWNFKE